MGPDPIIVQVMVAVPVTEVVPALAWVTVASVAMGPDPRTVQVMDAVPVTEVAPALAWVTVVNVVTAPVRAMAAIRIPNNQYPGNRARQVFLP
jgi:hypothetical protein